jgi:hypothetical protein
MSQKSAKITVRQPDWQDLFWMKRLLAGSANRWFALAE